MTIGMSTDIHPASSELAYLCPIEGSDVIGSAPPQLLESPEDGWIPLHEPGGDEERCRDAVLRQEGQRVRVIVLIPVVEGDRGNRLVAVVPLRGGCEVNQ